MINFIEFFLAESAKKSLSRIRSLVNFGQYPMAILTAFRGEYPYNKNVSRNSLLKSDLKGLRWGYTPVVGGYVEKARDEKGQETGEKRKVDSEESFFVVSKDDNIETFERSVKHLINKYDQEAAIIIYPDDEKAYLLGSDGSLSSLGSFSLNKLSDYYTRLLHKPDRQFTFE